MCHSRRFEAHNRHKRADGVGGKFDGYSSPLRAVRKLAAERNAWLGNIDIVGVEPLGSFGAILRGEPAAVAPTELQKRTCGCGDA